MYREYSSVIWPLLIKGCGGFLVEIICLVTDQVFLRSELSESKLFSMKILFFWQVLRNLITHCNTSYLILSPTPPPGICSLELHIKLLPVI